MTYQEILAAQGLNADQVAATLAAMKEHGIYLAGSENLDIRYNKLKTQHDELTAKHTEAQSLIEQMKASAAGSEALQGQITDYEARLAAMQKELIKSKIKSEAKLGLMEAGAIDVDYLLFKLEEKGELSLDEHEKIKGWEEHVTGLKTQLPQQFKSSSSKIIKENKLEKGEQGGSVTKEQFANMGYRERVKLFNEQPKVYNELKK